MVGSGIAATAPAAYTAAPTFTPAAQVATTGVQAAQPDQIAWNSASDNARVMALPHESPATAAVTSTVGYSAAQSSSPQTQHKDDSSS